VRRFWLLLLLGSFVAVTATLNALAIEVAIEGPKESAPGDLVILSAKATGAKNYAWTLANSTKTFLPVEGGTKAIFASGAAGKYIFILAASDETSLGQVKHEVTIGTPEPEPPPIPPPPPTPPTPSFPDGRFKLSAFTYAETLKLPVNVRKATSGPVASNFRSMAAAIAAGAVTDPQAVCDKTAEMNVQTMGTYRPQFEPWLKAMEKELDRLADQGLVSGEDYRVAWLEIADGLTEAAK